LGLETVFHRSHLIVFNNEKQILREGGCLFKSHKAFGIFFSRKIFQICRTKFVRQAPNKTNKRYQMVEESVSDVTAPVITSSDQIINNNNNLTAE
jgi:hypothetical protein